MTLQEQINVAKRTVNTDSLSFSLNEFVGMYEAGEININPAFQRTFRWGPEQQSNLIESLFIGIPLPAFFVYENTNGTWELIDGLQRFSTILKFMGKLRGPDGSGIEPPSILVGTKYLPGLEGAVWEQSSLVYDGESIIQKPLDVSQQLFLKRCRINVEVLKQPSTSSTKFDLFQRLNRGGSVANQQEVRTCFVVMKDSDFAQLIARLASGEEFRALCQLSDDDIRKQQDVEYATRVICLGYQDLGRRDDLNEFLDKAIMQICDERDRWEIEHRFSESIRLVYHSKGEDALIPTGSSRRVFTLQGLESILVGVFRNVDEIIQLADPTDYVGRRIDEFWESNDARVVTSSGMRASGRIIQTVPLGVRWFRPNVAG